MKYTIIFPVFNEEENLKTLYEKTKKVLNNIRAEHEFIFVNDGSTDHTANILRDLSIKDSSLKVVNLSRNFGHQMAVTCGMKYASGEVVAILDADLQDPPDILPKFFKKINEGYDVVYAIRKNRKEGLLMKITYNIFYRVLKNVASINIPLDSGDFCVMSKRVVEVLNKMPERNRFIRGLRSWVGFKQIGIEYERAGRFKGQSKYNFTRLLKLGFDGIFSFSYVPLQLMFYFGSLSLFLSFLGSLFAVYNRFFTKNYVKVPGFATTIILVMFIGGLQLFSMGLVGEYMRRIYEEIKKRPQYIVESTIGFEKINENPGVWF